MNRSFAFIRPIAISIMITSCGGSNPENHSDALAILNKAPFSAITDSIKKSPKEATLYLRRAGLLSQANNHELASEDYRTSWKLQPMEETGIQYAASLAILGRQADRLGFLQQAAQQFPASMNIKRLMGEAYADAGKSAYALELYNSILSKDSADFETWYEKGLLFEVMKDTTQAFVALRKAYELQPVNTYALELAHLYAETKNAQALKICDEVIMKDDSRQLVDPFFIKGIYYSNTDQFEPAIIQYDSCIHRDWKFTDAYIEKGIVFFKQKNIDEALNTFQLAARVSNTYPDSYYWMGRCYEKINRKEEARASYERAISLDRNFGEAKEALKRLKG
ncbi:MAG: tetratricopeptide repeat protein [Chitinophagales bacterium]